MNPSSPFKWFFFSACLCLFPLFQLRGELGTSEEPPEVSTTEGLPSNLVNQSVCVISGEYSDSVMDLIIRGPESLTIRRSYGSQSVGNIAKSWSFNHYDKLILEKIEQSLLSVAVTQPSGTQLNYIHPIAKHDTKKRRLQFQLVTPKGLTNGASTLSGKNNLANQKLYFYPEDEKIILISGAGNRCIFTKLDYYTKEDHPVCGQQREEKVNGSIYEYENKERLISKIICKGKGGLVFSYAEFENHPKKECLTLTTSDERAYHYYFKHHQFKNVDKGKAFRNTDPISQDYLIRVSHPYAPEENYEYEEKELSKELQICAKKRPEGRFTHIDYYHHGSNQVGGPVERIQISHRDDFRLDRVKKLKAPVGTDEKPITTHRFVYDCKVKKHKKGGHQELLEGTTDVYDALSHLTRYEYDASHRLTSIHFHQGVSPPYLPYRQEEFVWREDGTLMGKIFKDGDNRVHHARYFAYDDHGNVVTSSLCGKLTGLSAPELILQPSQYLNENGYECERKTYTYSQDGLNLVLTEKDSQGKTIVYDYIKHTDHLKAKYVIYDDKIQLREFYRYDDNYVLIRKIVDNGTTTSSSDLAGATERHFTYMTPRKTAPFGLAETIEERYWDFALGQEKLSRRMQFDYSREGRPIKQEVFDANGQLAYTLHWDYDLHGNVILETNALGEIITQEYDANDNLIYQKKSSSDFYLENHYDYANRLIKQEEIHSDGQQFATTYTYDYLGNRLTTTNPYGHTTTQTFDEFGRVIAIQYPAVLNEKGQLVHPTISKTYDLAGHPTCLTDPKGNQTHIETNIRGQPIHMTHPDGTQEHWLYRLDGQLIQHTTQTGTKSHYKRDPLGRVTEEITTSADGQILKKIHHLYNALHLTQTTDATGTITTYTYNSAGQLEWIKRNQEIQQNLYDSMGRLAETREWYGEPHEYRSTIKKYDLLDRLIEECIETSDGIPLHLTRYEYDSEGNRTLIQTGEHKTYTEYNCYHQPIKITNGLGHSTHVTYNYHFINPQGQRVLQTTTTDSLGYQTLHTYDTTQKLVETKRVNPFGQQVAHQITYYDLCGNPSRTDEAVIQQGEVKRIIQTLSTYSKCNQIETITEAAGTPEQKITRTFYNQGQKSATVKPDGTILSFEYDPLGHLRTIKSSDETIAYEYHYNLNDQVIKIIDLLSGQSTERTYDANGNMIKEKLANGLTLEYIPDPLGRTRTITLPDHTEIEYVYNAANLKEIHRIIDGKRLYTHKDQQHTLSGQVKKAQLPGNNGEVDYTYNGLGDYTTLKATQFEQRALPNGYDSTGRLLGFQAQGISYTFTYDDYSHVNSEEGHTIHHYTLDSLSNRITKDGEEHDYNALNQLVQKGEEQFEYDRNGNLMQRAKTQYRYDALDRLISIEQNGIKTHYYYDGFNRRIGKKQGQEEEYYIYQGQEEMGKWVQGKCQELRLLGKNKRSPMVALELQGIPYVPIHDFSGNVVCLLDHQGQVIERYRYTAFGESEILSPQGEALPHSAVENPWQYASKRLDNESQLIAFGLRYYAPELARWITCDPAGYTAGSNLYAYVHHSPLLYYDQFGLYDTTAVFGLAGSPLLDLGYHAFGATINGVQSYCQSTFGEPEITVQNRTIETNLKAQYQFRNQEYPYEQTATYSLKDPPFTDPRTRTPFNLKENRDIGIGFVHGIWTSFGSFKENMEYLGQFSEYNIKGVHCATLGRGRDIGCYFDALINRAAYEGVQELHKMWYDFFKDCSPNATFLTLCHSRGVVYVRNALLSFPEELRKRIEVIAIAPGGYVDSHLCHSVIHYASANDFIPLIDLAGRQRCKETIEILQPRVGACRYLDHSLMSPTYKNSLEVKIKRYWKK